MFCPRCGAQNKPEQKFCRNCGLSLPSVRLALEGKIDEGSSTLEKDVESIASGALTLVIFSIIALVTLTFSSGSAAFNLILGLLIGSTLLYKGLKRVNQAIKLISTQRPPAGQPGQSAVGEVKQDGHILSPVPDTDPLLAQPAPSSIAEHTTFELKRPEPRL